MFSSILTIFKQINHLQYSHCVNNIYFNNNQYSYCQKSGQLNNVKVQNDIVLAHKNNNVNLYIYANRTQQATMESQVFNYNIKTFAIFGFNNRQEIHDSQINMSLKFDVLQGALICIQCDVFVHNCTLVFVARGQQVSGVLIESLANIQIMQSFVQFRHASGNSSGIVNTVNNAMDNFTIAHCKLTGHNIITSPFNGYISSAVLTHVVVNVTDFYVCVGDTVMLGQLSVTITQKGSEVERCDICGSLYYVYGLCVDSIQYGTLANGTMQCVYPFEYANDKCECAYGHLRNGSACINLIDAIENQQNTETLLNNISSQFNAADQNLLYNTTILNYSISDNMQLVSNHIQNTISNIEPYIISNNTQILNNIIFNTTYFNIQLQKQIDELSKILNNQSNLEQQLINNLSQSENELLFNAIILKQNIQSNLINISKQIINNEMNVEQNILFNFSKVDTQILSNLTQQIQLVQDNVTNIRNYIITNVTYLESKMQGDATILDQRIYNNISQINLDINNNIYDLHLQSNISNQNVSTLNSQLQDRIQVYNDSMDYLQYQLTNLSFIISCLNNKGQMNQGMCFITKTVENVESQMICDQLSFYFIFDIKVITYSVIQNESQTESYFDGTNVIANAFIDVADNIYSCIQPIFHNQSSFVNIKIQLGKQSINSGSLLTNSQTLIVNEMIILTKSDCTLQVNQGQLNIIFDSSNNTNIINLLINVKFEISSSNISLFNKIFEYLNISNYHILGCYQSSKTVAMIGLVVDSAVININYLTFSPYIYNVGNYSSYLMSVVTKSEVNIQNIAILIGNASAQSCLSSIITTQDQQIQFGGLVSNLQDSTMNLIKLVSDSYQTVSTEYIQNSGMLIGYTTSELNSIKIDNLCLQQQLQSLASSFSNFGLIGTNSENASITNSVLIFEIEVLCLKQFGIIGNQSTLLTQTSDELMLHVHVTNIQIHMNLTAYNDSFSVSAVSGKLVGNLIIENFKLKNALIRSVYRIGGLVGFSYNSNIKILSVHIFNNSFYAKDTYVSLIVTQLIQSTVMANDLFISQNIISSQHMVGGLVAMGSESQIYAVNLILDNSLHADGMAGGFIGLGNSVNYTINQLKLQGTISVEQWNAGSICGVAYGGQIGINNSIIQKNNVTAMFKVGAVVAYCTQSQYIIDNLTINYCNISAQEMAGAISQADNSQYIVTKFNMLNTIVVGQRYVGGFVAHSRDSQFLINNLLIQSCQILSDTEHAAGFGGSVDKSSCSIYDSIIENTEISADRFCGGFISYQFNCSEVVSNLSLSELSISANNIAGGFSGQSYYTNITANKLNITLSSIKSSNHVVGGFVGQGVYLHIIMQNSSIILVQISGLKYYGLIIGIDERENVFQISSSTSSKYQINNILQEDCPSLTNNYSVNQCS
ncbi:Conserved_hypothetical protein [Hexamita inflata]|uniref:Uncharacterized protein n=1 Tax=Hexamita inflata TaxID=28002 RepID=A0ABP1HC11_9EUKA